MSTKVSPPPEAGRRRLDLREALLDAASEMLMRDGPDGISLRKLAAKVGTSTMSVYTIFGGKDGLQVALFEEAYERLADTHYAVARNPEPILWLWDLACAYRQFALKNPAYYALMISLTMPVLSSIRRDTEDSKPAARFISHHRAYSNLLEAVNACVADGSMSNDLDPRIIADALWATVHGLCSLELSGFYSTQQAAEKRFNFCADASIRGMLTPEGVQRLNKAIAAV
jgi:AcrR family transcriptional regulator